MGKSEVSGEWKGVKGEGGPGSWSCQNSLQQRTFPLSNPRVAIKWPLPQRPSKIPPSVSALLTQLQGQNGSEEQEALCQGGSGRRWVGPSAVGGAINSRPSGAFQFLSNGQGLCGIGMGEDRRRHIHRNGSCAQERWPGPLSMVSY